MSKHFADLRSAANASAPLHSVQATVDNLQTETTRTAHSNSHGQAFLHPPTVMAAEQDINLYPLNTAREQPALEENDDAFFGVPIQHYHFKPKKGQGLLDDEDYFQQKQRLHPKVVNIRQKMELSKLASRIQQEHYENFLKPGMSQSRASLKQLSRFNKDKLNYKNEDYERQQMLFRQYRYEEKFKDKMTGEAPAGTFLT